MSAFSPKPRRLHATGLLLALVGSAAVGATPSSGAAELVTPSQPRPEEAGAAEQLKVAVLDLKAGPGIDANLAPVVTEALVAAIAHRQRLKVISSKEVATVLGFERQRELLGCADESSCMAELGGALGVDRLVSGSIGMVGGSSVFTVQSIDVRSGQTDKRYATQLRGGSEEDFLREVDPAAEMLFPGRAATAFRLSRAALEGKWTVAARGQVGASRTLSAAWVVRAGYRLGESITLGLGALVTGSARSPVPGGLLRVSWVPLGASARWRPFLAFELPVLFSVPVLAGPGGSLGVDFAVTPWLTVGLELPFYYLATAPADTESLYLFVAATVGFYF